MPRIEERTCGALKAITRHRLRMLGDVHRALDADCRLTLLGHDCRMGRDPAERTDLFPTATASTSPTNKAATESAPQRYILPKNLRNAVKHLSDSELDLMHAATLEEMKHRGRTPRIVETPSHTRPDLTKIQSPPTKTAKLNTAEVSLTRGQVNAVRSAFKAGVTPSRIAREFGIPLSDVRQALAADKTKR
jgi:hypothetical protein